MARVVADGADVDVERWADHLAVRVLQHVGRVDRLRLVVVLAHCHSVVIHLIMFKLQHKGLLKSS